MPVWKVQISSRIYSEIELERGTYSGRDVAESIVKDKLVTAGYHLKVLRDENCTVFLNDAGGEVAKIVVVK